MLMHSFLCSYLYAAVPDAGPGGGGVYGEEDGEHVPRQLARQLQVPRPLRLLLLALHSAGLARLRAQLAHQLTLDGARRAVLLPERK